MRVAVRMVGGVTLHPLKEVRLLNLVHLGHSGDLGDECQITCGALKAEKKRVAELPRHPEQLT